jgi:hypothetical protein
MKIQTKAALIVGGLAVVGVAAVVSFAGITSQETIETYVLRTGSIQSVDDLVSQSSVVVEVEVDGAPSVSRDKTGSAGPTTSSYSAIVISVVAAPQAVSGGTVPKPGDDIEILQFGEPGDPETVDLKAGKYLLFLRSSVLEDGSITSEYFITGVTSGAYRLNEGRYEITNPSDEDKLPQTIDSETLIG